VRCGVGWPVWDGCVVCCGGALANIGGVCDCCGFGGLLIGFSVNV
jgi:hypothetical protein